MPGSWLDCPPHITKSRFLPPSSLPHSIQFPPSSPLYSEKIAGASFSVMRNGQIVTMQTHGYSNVETEQPILAVRPLPPFLPPLLPSSPPFSSLLPVGRLHVWSFLMTS